MHSFDDSQLVFEVFFNARLSDPDKKRSFQSYYEAVLNEIGRRNLLTIRELELVRKRGRLSHYQLGKTYEELVALGGPPTYERHERGKIISVVYEDRYEFINRTTEFFSGANRYLKYTKHCFQNGKIISTSYRLEMGESYYVSTSKGCVL